ncbi:MAG: VWA domain-containing protein [Chloroflexota bacterium]
MNNPFLSNLLYFTDALRRAGASISLEQTLEVTRALEMVDIREKTQVYHSLRCLLINRKEDLPLFDQMFALFWRAPNPTQRGRGQKAPIAPRHDVPKPKRLNIVTLMAEKAQASAPEVEAADKSGSYSATELLQRKEFSAMTPDELAAIKRLIQAMRWQVSLRQTRRYVPNPQGAQLDLRQSMRSFVKHGGVPVKLSWKQRAIKARPVVVLADISGSMEKYTRLLLQFYYSMTRSLADVECFVFGTRLSRITPQLRIRNIDRAINEASKQVVDWAGGTRIGDNLHTFNRDWSRRVLRRGAIVLIISDGWERSDVATLKQEMRYLQHRCHRLLWLNPLLGNTRYQPIVEGMAAALPFIDDFLPIHNLQSLEALNEHLAQLN